tara:strand:+ start:93 stop:551 length:459 start_codon:yes stop_codon:yes gene_type:complete
MSNNNNYYFKGPHRNGTPAQRSGMAPGKFNYYFTGPPCQTILIKNRGNNAKLIGTMPMPAKFDPSDGSSSFANARMEYSKDAGGGTALSGNFDQSSYIHLKKINAVGKGSMKQGLSFNDPFSFRSQDVNVVRSRLQRTRAGGAVAPKKCSAY